MDSFTTWMLKGILAKQEKSRLSTISNSILKSRKGYLKVGFLGILT